MPKYHKIISPDLKGEIYFYGNIGALSEFLDRTGKGIDSLQSLTLKDIYPLMYEAYVISCLRQKIEIENSFEDFRLFVNSKELIKLYPIVLNEILEDGGFTDKVEKKTVQKVK